jgi:hypothetical protein
MTTTTTDAGRAPTGVLTITQAEKLLGAERRVINAKRALERLEGERNELRGRYETRVVVDAGWIEKGKGRWRRRTVRTSDSFSLSKYREKHTITAAMRRFITKPAQSTRTQWDFEDLETADA